MVGPYASHVVRCPPQWTIRSATVCVAQGHTSATLAYGGQADAPDSFAVPQPVPAIARGACSACNSAGTTPVRSNSFNRHAQRPANKSNLQGANKATCTERMPYQEETASDHEAHETQAGSLGYVTRVFRCAYGVCLRLVSTDCIVRTLRWRRAIRAIRSGRWWS